MIVFSYKIHYKTEALIQINLLTYSKNIYFLGLTFKNTKIAYLYE